VPGRYAWISLAALSTLRHLQTVEWMAEAIHAVRGPALGAGAESVRVDKPAALSTLRRVPTVGWMAEAIHAVRGPALGAVCRIGTRG
jgi:hypothetical protein